MNSEGGETGASETASGSLDMTRFSEVRSESTPISVKDNGFSFSSIEVMVERNVRKLEKITGSRNLVMLGGPFVTVQGEFEVGKENSSTSWILIMLAYGDLVMISIVNNQSSGETAECQSQRVSSILALFCSLFVIEVVTGHH